MNRKQYSLDFKRDVVQLALSGEKSKAQTARDLGLSETVLYKWIAAYGPAAPAPVVAADAAEVQRLRRALARAEMERDILKKAIGIFSEAPR
jgi:transposase